MDTTKSLDLKLLAMQELMAKERKAAEAAYSQKRAAGSFVLPDLAAADEAVLPEILLQHYTTARPITEPFTITVGTHAAAVQLSHQNGCCVI
jgi:PPE-repeat protein